MAWPPRMVAPFKLHFVAGDSWKLPVVAFPAIMALFGSWWLSRVPVGPVFFYDVFVLIAVATWAVSPRGSAGALTGFRRLRCSRR